MIINFAVGAIVVVVAVNVLVWAKEIIGMAVVLEVLVIDVAIIVVGVVVVILNFALSISYSVDVPSDVAADLFMDALAAAMLGVLTVIGVESFADMNATVSTVALPALEVRMSTKLEEFRP